MCQHKQDQVFKHQDPISQNYKSVQSSPQLNKSS